ncbi:hypothetical protein [Brevibacterium album]|uniref:hypothetical protein n=1 Tax=Brevibacterium album TaxID=417948 RepID=UPI000415F72B|nr:hypothetical protein [Brevibacterium album]
MSMFSTTGAWADVDPREAVSRAVSAVEGAPRTGSAVPLPLMSQPAAGGTRWAADALGLAAQLLPELPVDIGPAGWRLLGARAATAARSLDARREASRLGRTLDAMSEYAERSGLPVLVSVPGPWTLVRRLGLPDESPALGDPGARRDVIQAYAEGLRQLRERVQGIVGEGPAGPDDPAPLVRIRLVEEELDAVLTGTVPTASGYRTLPAVPDAQVTAALRSLIARTGEGTILSLPSAGTVRLAGKAIPHTQLARDAGVSALAVGLERSGGGSWAGDRPQSGTGTRPGSGAQQEVAAHAGTRPGDRARTAARPGTPLTAQAVRRWERLAEWTEAGGQLWLRVPPHAAAAPEAVTGWVEAVAEPWQAVGMNREGLAAFGILTGEELPVGAHPLLPEDANPERSRAHLRMASGLARALADQAG